MNMKIMDWLLLKENKSNLPIVAILMVFVPLAYFIGIGFKGDVIYEGVYPNAKWITDWFRGWFEAIMMLSFLFGLILLVLAFSRFKVNNED